MKKKLNSQIKGEIGAVAKTMPQQPTSKKLTS